MDVRDKEVGRDEMGDEEREGREANGDAVGSLPDEMGVEVMRWVGPAMGTVCRAVCRRWGSLVAAAGMSPSGHQGAVVDKERRLVWAERCVDVWCEEWTVVVAVGLRDRCARTGDGRKEAREARTMRAVAGCGRKDVLRRLREDHGFVWDRWTCAEAARNGEVEALRYAHEHGCPWDEWTCWYAANNGEVETLRYAHEHGCPWDGGTCRGAASNGQVETLRYLHEHGCPWDEATYSRAAYAGHMEALRYLHEHGCPWNVGTCAEAAMNGQVEALRYLHEHGCPWNVGTCWEAARNGQVETLRYAYEHGCPCDRTLCRMAAKVRGQAEVVRWLDESDRA